MGTAISGMEPIGGNSARLMADSNQAIDAIVDLAGASDDDTRKLAHDALVEITGNTEIDAGNLAPKALKAKWLEWRKANK